MYEPCCFNCWDIALKRLLKPWALVNNAWREALSVELPDNVCSDEKNDCSVLVIPVPLSDSNLSTCVACPR
ncbi:hypothetical protein D3C73_1627260 [compost metagenome]